MAPKALLWTFTVLQAREKPSVKADLAIYTHVLGVPGQYESVDLMISHKMDFNGCANRDGFHTDSHIYWFIAFRIKVVVKRFTHAINVL